MKLLGWIMLIGLLLLGLFAMANWNLLTAPATLNFLVFTVQGPLGVILLGVTLVFVALFSVYALSLRTASLLETRHHLKEMESQRNIADKEEASRLATLSAQMEQEFTRLRELIQATGAETLHRSDAVEHALLKTVDITANSLYAHLGQIDDKLNRLTTSMGRAPAS